MYVLELLRQYYQYINLGITGGSIVTRDYDVVSYQLTVTVCTFRAGFVLDDYAYYIVDDE